MKNVTIDGVDYDFDKLGPEQKVLANHIADLDRKLSSARFNIDQMHLAVMPSCGFLNDH